MKKTFKALLGIVAVAAVACQPKENISTPSAVRLIPITLSAEQDATRTHIEQTPTGWQPYWNEQDSIFVTHDADFGKAFTFRNKSGAGTTASFTGSIEATDGTLNAYAFLPKKDGRDNNVFKFIIPELQTVPELSTFDPAADLMVSDACELNIQDGALASAGTLHFHRLMAVAKLVIADASTGSKLAGKAIKSVTLKSSSEILTGRVLVNITTAQVSSWESKNSQKQVTVAYEGSDWIADGETAAYIILNPTTLAAGSTLTASVVTDDSGIEVERSVTLSSDVQFVTGKVNTLTFRIEDADITESTGIEPTTWDFSEQAWQDTFAKYGNINTDITGWNLTFANLTIVSSNKSKYNTSFFQWGGAGSTSDRYMKFTAATKGKLTVWATNTGSSVDMNRKVNVSAGSYSSSIAAGVASVSSAAAAMECVFKDVPAGEVLIYPSGNALRFYKLEFTGEVQEAEPTPDPEPDEGGEQECTTPPTVSTVDPLKMYGFAEAAGVTGGDDASSANILHFNNGKALQTWLLARAKSEKQGDHSPVTIWLSGTFGPSDGRDFSEAHPWFDVKEVSNLSIYGTDSFVMDRIGFFAVSASNIIFRNINFQQPKANNGADAISMQKSDGIWVDHCTFTSLNQEKDYEDGSTDITHGSKNVTVSWCHYIQTQKTCLVGHSNSQTSDTQITATFHHNWFDSSSSRHPRVRFGWAHVYNNLYDGCTTYGAGSAYGARVLVEYNYFDSVQLPTDICTYPAKENGESNLQGSVAGYLYPTQNVYVNRPPKAKDPYPLCNVKFTSYRGSTITPLTYEDFKPEYRYEVTAAELVPEVVRANAGYGKMGWTEAPVAVNNGGITEYNGTDPDEPIVEGGAHTHVFYYDSSSNAVNLTDGAAGSYFTATAKTDLGGDYGISDWTLEGYSSTKGVKLNSTGSVSFTTSASVNSSVQFWFIRRKTGDSTARIQLVPAGGTAQVFETPYDTIGESGVITLEKGTAYTIKQDNKEQALLLVIVKETE